MIPYYEYRKPLLIALLLLTLVVAWGLGKLGVSFSFEDYFPESHPELQYYEKYRKVFPEPQKRSLYLALESGDNTVYELSFLRKADSIFKRIEQIEGIDSAYYATDLSRYQWDGIRLRSRPYFPLDSGANLSRAKHRVQQDSVLTSMFVSQDQRYLGGYFLLAEDIFDQPERDRVCREVEALLEEQKIGFELSGIPFIRFGYTRRIQEELGVFMLLSVGLILLVLGGLFRRFLLMALPLLCLTLGVVWLMGLMGWTGQALDLMSNMLIPIVFVVGVSDVVHLLNHYLKLRNRGQDSEQAIRQTLLDIGQAVFLTSLTTAIGFASLIISPIGPIRRFGLFAAFGVMITFAITVLILPGVLGSRKLKLPGKGGSSRGQKIIQGILVYFYQWGLNSPMIILTLSMVLLAGAGYYITRIPASTYLIEDIGPNDPIRKTSEFFERQFYGTRTFELAIEVQEGFRITDLAVLQDIEAVEQFLAGQERFAPFLSPASLVRELNYISHFSRPSYRHLPANQKEVEELLDLAVANTNQQLLSQVMNQERKLGRIRSNLPDIGSEAFDSIRSNLENFIRTQSNSNMVHYRMTGHSYILELNLKFIRNSLRKSLLLACTIIGLIMGLRYRSFKILILSLLPNLIPLILMGGILGLLNLPLTTSTSVVFVIAFGIVVDDTIHFMSRFRQERHRGATKESAIKISLLETGQAMVQTSLVISGGFAVMMTSDFGGIFSTGFFTILALGIALLADLLLLPVLLRKFL